MKIDELLKNDSRIRRLAKGTGLSEGLIKKTLQEQYNKNFDTSTLIKIAKHNCPSWGHSHCENENCSKGLISDKDVKEGNVILNAENVIMGHKTCLI